MTAPQKKPDMMVLGGLSLVVACIAGIFLWTKAGVPQSLLPVVSQISKFNLTNQNGRAVSLTNFLGKVWIADIIFTRCGGPCPVMTHHLAMLQTNLPADDSVHIVTLTSDPQYDTPPILQRYASRFNSDSNRWDFLTGPKSEIQRLAVNDFKFVAIEKKPEEQKDAQDLFIHSTWFVVVDKRGRVRGWNDSEGHLHAYFDSEDPATQTEILKAVQQLLREPAS